MSNGNQEQERLKRLRDRQLSERDPLVKQRQFQRMSARNETHPNDFKKPVCGQAFLCTSLRSASHGIQ